LLCDAARWTFLTSLIYAPWAYGCTTAKTVRGLNYFLAVALGLWGISLLLGVVCRGRDAESQGAKAPEILEVRSQKSEVSTESFRERGVPPMVIVVGACLLIIGWWMTLNARWIYDADFFLFIPRAALFGGSPGSVDYAISLAWMIRASLLLGVVLFVSELSRDPVWLSRLWWTIAIAGGSIALLGLVQKATGAPMIFWQKRDIPVAKFFATYYAHGNAGAYLNLVLPVVIPLALRGFLRRTKPLVRAIALVLSLLLVVAAMANTSRGGQAIAVCLVVALTICLRDILFARVRRMEKSTLLLAVGVIAFALIAVAGVSHLDRSLGRWHEAIDNPESNSRWLVSRAALRSVGDAGWFGFGPGTFRVVFPYYTNGLGPKVEGLWRFLHEDYLQTLMEWGWIGSASWAFIFFGSMWTAVRTLARGGHIPLSGRQRLFLTGAVLALAGIALHAFVDFPLQIASLQLYVATYVGVCWGSSSWK
jgi:hypothetical protein